MKKKKPTSKSPKTETPGEDVTHMAEKKTKSANPKAADSRAFLTDALFLLLEEQEFKKLTVKEVVEKAGVGRATFYRHYETLEDIVDDYVMTLQKRIWRDPGAAAQTGESSDDSERLEEMSTDVRSAAERVFRILSKEKKNLRILKKQGLQNKISGMIYRLTLTTIQDLGVLNNKYQPYFFAGAASAIVLAWLEYDMKESPKEMADLFMKSLRGYMDI